MMHPEIERFLRMAGRTAGNCRLVIETADRRFDPLSDRVLVRLLNEHDDGAAEEVARWTGDIHEIFRLDPSTARSF